GRRSAPALGLVNEHLCHPLGNSGAGRRAEGHLLRHRWHRHRFVWRWQPASLCGEVGTGRWPRRAAPHRPQCPAGPRAAATSLPPRFRLGNLVSRTTSAGLTREHTRMQETNAAALLEHLAGLLAEQQRQRQELARLALVEAVSERVHQEILLLVDTLNQHGVELTGAARVVPAAAECIRRQAARLAELEARLDPC